MLVANSCVGIVTEHDGVSDIKKIERADIEAFTAAIIDNVFDASLRANYNFALGYAAAIDAFCAGKIDFADPQGAVDAAWHDVNDVSGKPPVQTDVLKTYCYGAGAPS